jgi:hypothetical protein
VSSWDKLSPFEKFFSALQASGCNPRPSGDQCRASCPSHDDSTPSLYFKEGDGGIVVFDCKGSCAPEAVVAALGMKMSDLFPEDRPATNYRLPKRPSTPAPTNGEKSSLPDPAAFWSRLVESDPEGEAYLASRKLWPLPETISVRFNPGDPYRVVLRLRAPDGSVVGFQQRAIDGRKSKCVTSKGTRMKGSAFGLVPPEGDVLIVEGLTDTLAAHILGYSALGAPGQGSAAALIQTRGGQLSGRRVYVALDSDEAGRMGAAKAMEAARNVGADARLVELPEGAKDLAELLARDGKERAQELLAAALDQAKPTEPESDGLVCLDSVEPEEVAWLWPGRIPLGKITILDGDPGLSKSTLTLDIASRLTTGRGFPDSLVTPHEPADVVVLSAEDGLADTIRPRLDAAGAAVSRVHALQTVRDDTGDTFPSLDRHVEQIRAAVLRTGSKLVIVDPLMAYIGGPEVNSYRDQDVRRVLAPLAWMAEETGVAVVVIRHLNKAAGGAAIYRGGGSIGIIGAARSGLLVAKDPEDESRRILAMTKSNLAPPAASLTYRLATATNGAPKIEWEGTSRTTADQLLAAAAGDEEDRSALGEAKEFLREALVGGSLRPSPEVISEGRRAGISEKTLRRAFRALGGKATKSGMAGGWCWSIPEDGQDDHLRRCPSGSEDGQLSNIGQLGHLRGELAIFGAAGPNGQPDSPVKQTGSDGLERGDL